MCELMGMCFARPISADFSIREFAIRCEENADGWGLAWYPDQSLAIVKEPVCWTASPYTSFLEKYPRLLSSIYVAHVRDRSVGGEPTHADTHPFARELYGREYCFAHNGTLTDFSAEFHLGRYRPVGATDSEYMFCHLIEELALRQRHLDGDGDWHWLREKLLALNRRGNLTCLLADGLRLFSYRDITEAKGLSFRKVYFASHEVRRSEDSKRQFDLEAETVNCGYVIATSPLSQDGWHDLLPGELIVLDSGRICFSSGRDHASL
jgi:glutamine amidotransferase